jgi:hypothetical protein
MCIYVCICMCIYVCICMEGSIVTGCQMCSLSGMCMYIVYVCMYVCISVCVCVCVCCLHMYMYGGEHRYGILDVFIEWYVYVYVYVCVYMYVYVWREASLRDVRCVH